MSHGNEYVSPAIGIVTYQEIVEKWGSLDGVLRLELFGKSAPPLKPIEHEVYLPPLRRYSHVFYAGCTFLVFPLPVVKSWVQQSLIIGNCYRQPAKVLVTSLFLDHTCNNSAGRLDGPTVRHLQGGDRWCRSDKLKRRFFWLNGLSILLASHSLLSPTLSFGCPFSQSVSCSSFILLSSGVHPFLLVRSSLRPLKSDLKLKVCVL